MAADPTTLALDYMDLADQFEDTFLSLPERPPPHWPRYFLATQAFELGLKGYLLFRGTPESKLRDKPIMHDLAALLRMAKSKGLSLSDHASQTIELLSEPHKGYRPRYPKRTGKCVITIDQCSEDLRKLLIAIRPAKREAAANAKQ
jgi:HEPN domain-containing protein